MDYTTFACAIVPGISYLSNRDNVLCVLKHGIPAYDTQTWREAGRLPPTHLLHQNALAIRPDGT